jgi:nicotinate-nucleotide adenylyltransferase
LVFKSSTSFQSKGDTSYHPFNPFDAGKVDKMTKIYFGGAFNPIHTGHLVVARAIAEATGFSKVALVPTAQPPHKPITADLAGSQHRLRMCQLVAHQDPLFEVENIELGRSGPSYTLDTVQELKRRGETEITWLIGADMVQILPKWHQAMELLKEVRFVIADRHGYEIDWSALPAAFQSLRGQVVRAPMMEISASQIRQRVRERRSIRYLVPPEVEGYIAEHRLYEI